MNTIVSTITDGCMICYNIVGLAFLELQLQYNMAVRDRWMRELEDQLRGGKQLPWAGT